MRTFDGEGMSELGREEQRTCSLTEPDPDDPTATSWRPGCTEPATIRITSSTNPWPLQYACGAEHAELVAEHVPDPVSERIMKGQ